MTMDIDLAYEIGVEGYTYLYPVVLMETTRRQMTNVESAGQVIGRGPADTFVHLRAFPPADFRDVVRPNFDTLYSVAWLDLREEPRIVSVGSAGDDGYYLLPHYDMWGEVFACPGTRTTGNEANDFAIVGPGWSGDTPEGVRRYAAPTDWVWIIGRTKASVATYEAVHAFQDRMSIAPRSSWGGPRPAVAGVHDPSIDDTTPPLRTVFAMDAAAFFGTAARLLGAYPPHFQDSPTLDRLARIGFRAGRPFDLQAAEPAVKEGLERAVPAAQARITDQQTKLGRHQNGWGIVAGNMGNYGTDYLQRACVELVGLGANLPEDAIYPVCYVDADGRPLTGEHRYVWHFDAKSLPPVKAFWSATLYDAEGFQVANEINRFAIGDRNDLAFNDDGSLDILIQHERPESGTSNWLPSPQGGFNLCARLYYPKAEVLDGSWSPPPVQRVG